MSSKIRLPSPSAQNREFIFEMMGFIRLTAEAAQLSCQLADDAALEHQLRRMIAHVRAATATYRELAKFENARRAESEAA